jgi:hypothetical protein
MLYAVRATKKLAGTLILKFSKDRNFRLTKSQKLNLTEEEYLSAKVQNMLQTQYLEDIVITEKNNEVETKAIDKSQVISNVEKKEVVEATKTDLADDATKPVSWDGEKGTLLNAKESKAKALDNLGGKEMEVKTGITIDLDDETEALKEKSEKKTKKANKTSKLTAAAKKALEQVKKDILNESDEPDPDFVFENSKTDVGFVDKEQQAEELAKIAHLKTENNTEMEL